MKPRISGSLPCWPTLPDNDGKTNDGQRERQRGSPMGNATKRKAQSRAMALCIVRHCGFTLFLSHPLSFAFSLTLAG